MSIAATHASYYLKLLDFSFSNKFTAPKMMSKGNFFFNERIKAGFPLVNEACGNVFIARSRLAFPQGLRFVYDMFKGGHLSDVYAHPYFIEKQSNPDQPSPQLHLTEELQGCTRVVKSLMYMGDSTSKLDNAMMVVSDPTLLDADGRAYTVLYNPVEPDEKTLYVINKRLENKDVQAIIVPSRQAFGQLRMWMERFPKAHIIASGNGIPESAVEDGLFDTVVSRDDIEVDITTPFEAKFLEDDGFYRVVSEGNKWDGSRVFSDNHEESDMVPAGDRPSLDAKGKMRWDEAFGRAVDSIPLVHAGMHSGSTPNSNESSISATLKELAGKKEMDLGKKGKRGEDYESALLPEFVVASAAKRVAYRARIQRYIEKRFTFVPAPSLKATPLVGQASFADCNRPIFLTRNIAIQRVPGDDLTNELILLDRLSNSISCTDLFHGGYADFDPLNTWMCRVWFKFNRGGDYKDSRVMPGFKRAQITRHHGGLEEIQAFVKELGSLEPNHTGEDVFSRFDRDVGSKLFMSGPGRRSAASGGSKFHVNMVCHAHGTPPTIVNIRTLLLAQYDLAQCEKPHQQDRSIVEGMGIGISNPPTMM